MTKPIDGLDQDQCETLAEWESRVEEELDEIEEELEEELTLTVNDDLTVDEVDEEKAKRLVREYQNLNEVGGHLQRSTGSVCAIGTTSPEVDEGVDCDDLRALASLLDEYESVVLDSLQTQLVEDDWAYMDDVSRESKKQAFVRSARNAQDTLGDNPECDIDVETSDNAPRGAQTVVCKGLTGDEKEECIDRRTTSTPQL